MKIGITGGSGFVGTILIEGLSKSGNRLENLDQYQGLLVSLLSKKWLQPVYPEQIDGIAVKVSNTIWKYQRRVFRKAVALGLIRPSGLDILDRQGKWISQLSGLDAVIHLAGIPHPGVYGMRETDFYLVNYWGAVNIFEATVAAGIKKFIFASSGQVYNINKHAGWSKFPVTEDDADAIQASDVIHIYGRLKWQFEQYLKEQSAANRMQSFALRLEFPGIWGASNGNLFIQTSVENLVQAFEKAVSAKLIPGAYIVNVADRSVPAVVGNPQQHVAQSWPHAVSPLSANDSLWSTQKAAELLDYAPTERGRYYHKSVAFSSTWEPSIN